MYFRSRLQAVLVLFLACWACLVIRLFQLQVLKADQYREDAERRRLIGRRLMSPIRGRIVDRHGHDLARDEPAWGIAVDYRLLRGDRHFIEALATRLLREQGPDGLLDEDQASAQVQREVNELWSFLEDWAGREAVQSKRQAIVEQVEAWRRHYLERSLIKPKGHHPAIREEQECHCVVEGLSKGEELSIRLWQQEQFGFLLRLGVVQISDSTHRVYPDGTAAAHLLGQLGEVSADDLFRKPFRNEQDHVDWGGYRLGDLCGRSGVEHLAEPVLRGQRGQLLEYIDERPPQRLEPVHGQDVALTLDAALQSSLHALLQQFIAAHNGSSGEAPIPGGSIVVLDVATRDVLAMVSFPSYDPNSFATDYSALREDVVGMPLRHRAISASYAPGSIVKPITIAAAQHAGIITLGSTVECDGYLNHNKPDQFRCWRPADSSTPRQHGLINSQQAITGSCNIFCFKMGNRLCERFGGASGGVEELCTWLGRFGVGRATGIGLDEEASGILPEPQWLRRQQQRGALIADARNYAIGQGEMQVTPLQAANIVATYAGGVFRPVRLLASAPLAPAEDIPWSDDLWRAIREGMFGVVNDPQDGTAPKARLEHPGFFLCGKSGSAETPPWPIRFTVHYPGGGMEVHASSPHEARQRCLAVHRELKVEDLRIERTARFPGQPPKAGREFSHAWFVAFLQPRHGTRPDWSVPAPLAIAVLLEFGGSGGTVAGPLCRDVAELLIHEFPQYLSAPPDPSEVGA